MLKEVPRVRDLSLIVFLSAAGVTGCASGCRLSDSYVLGETIKGTLCRTPLCFKVLTEVIIRNVIQGVTKAKKRVCPCSIKHYVHKVVLCVSTASSCPSS